MHRRLEPMIYQGSTGGLVFLNEQFSQTESVSTDKEIKSVPPSLEILFNSMAVYLEGRKEGKAFHDPLAASIAFDESICDFLEVEIYRKDGKWGAYPRENTNKFISVGVDKEKFVNTLFNF